MIRCDLHDYIEIACTYRFPIKLTLKSGEVVKCRALDTEQNKDRRECVKVEVSGVERLIELEDILLMEALVDNPHFARVTFG